MHRRRSASASSETSTRNGLIVAPVIVDSFALSTQRAECGAQLLREHLWFFPGGEVAAALGLVEVDEVVVRLLGPTARRPDVLVREHRHRGWERQVGRGVEVPT